MPSNSCGKSSPPCNMTHQQPDESLPKPPSPEEAKTALATLIQLVCDSAVPNKAELDDAVLILNRHIEHMGRWWKMFSFGGTVSVRDCEMCGNSYPTLGMSRPFGVSRWMRCPDCEVAERTKQFVRDRGIHQFLVSHRLDQEFNPATFNTIGVPPTFTQQFGVEVKLQLEYRFPSPEEAKKALTFLTTGKWED